jgi:nicotinamide-nucleotide amidase
MPVAEIIAIGTELLLGETQDTNTQYLARKLRDSGIDMFRATIIGDNPARIALCIQEAIQRAQIIITTGGLGPTIDDPTRQAIALAFGVETEFNEVLWEQIQRKYRSYNRIPSDNNRRQAYIPLGAIGIENPVGTAPGFYFEKDDFIVISLPGVPKEMEYLTTNFVLPYLKDKYQLKSVIQVKVIHTAGIGESLIDQLISDLENMQNPTVGLSAHAGQCDIRVTAKAESAEQANRMIAELVVTIYERLGNNIYGYDLDTLEGEIQQILNLNHLTLNLVNSNISENIFARFRNQSPCNVHLLPEMDMTEIRHKSAQLQHPLTILFFAQLLDRDDRKELNVSLSKFDGEFQEKSMFYGGPPQMGEQWAVNTAMDYLRRNINPGINKNP